MDSGSGTARGLFTRWAGELLVPLVAVGAGTLGVNALRLWAQGSMAGPLEQALSLAPASAVTLLLGAMALLAERLRSGRAVAVVVRLVLAGAMGLLSVGLVSEHILDLPWHAEPWAVGAGVSSRTALGLTHSLTALASLLSSLALLSAFRPASNQLVYRAVGISAASVTLLIAVVGGTANLLGQWIPQWGFTAMSSAEAMGFLLLSIGILIQGGVGKVVLRGFRRRHEVPGDWGEAVRIFGLAAAVATVLVVLGMARLVSDHATFRGQIVSELTTVAALKRAEFQGWFAQRQGDARALGASPAMMDALLAAREGRTGSEAVMQASRWLEAVRSSYGYRAITVADTALSPVLVAGELIDFRDRHLAEGLAAARAGADPIWVNIHETGGGTLALDFPFRVADPSGASVLGFVILRMDPTIAVFPRVQWPGVSTTAEVMLLRQEGSELVAVSRPRFGAEGPGELRRPLDSGALPWVGGTGGGVVREGLDYRGVPALSTAQRILGTPWVLGVKMDVSEAYAPLMRSDSNVIVIVVLLVLAIGGGALYVWRQRISAAMEAKLAAEQGLRRDAERLAHLVEWVDVGILLLDDGLRVVEANPAARTMYGLGPSLVGKALSDIEVPGAEQSLCHALPELPSDGPVALDTYHRRGDGSPFAVEVLARRTTLEGVPHFLVLARDVEDSRAAQERLRLLDAAIAAAGASVVITDRNGMITWVNPRFAQDSGYTLEEAVGRTPRIVKSGRHPLAYYKELWDTIQSGRAWTGVLVNRSKRGEEYVEDAVIAPVTGRGGTITHFVGIKTNITERVRAQEELRKRESIFSAIVEHSTDSYAMVDPETQRLTEFNETAYRILGYSREEFARLRVPDLIPSLDASQVRALHRKLIESGGMTYETQHRHRDGHLVDVRVTSRPITSDGRVHLAMVCSDISDQKRLEAELEMRRGVFAAIADTSRDAITLVDQTDLSFIEFNTAAHAMLGYTREEFACLTVPDVEAAMNADEVAQVAREAVQVGAADFDTRVRCKDGSERQVHTSVRPVEIGGEMFLSIIWSDFAEEHALDDELRERGEVL